MAAAVVLASSFLPWLRSGARSRSSYDLFQIVDRLGFSPDGTVGWAVRLWPLLPFLLVLTIVVHWLPDHVVAISAVRPVLTILVAVYAGGIALAILLAPEIGLFSVRAGPWVTLPGALLMLVGAVSRGSADREAS